MVEQQLSFETPTLDFKNFSDVVNNELEKKKVFESAKKLKNETMAMDPEAKKL